jgi:hypothetical protein
MAANREEATEEDELEWYSRRLDAGLSSLQNADYVLAWVCMEEDGVSLFVVCISQSADKDRLEHMLIQCSRERYVEYKDT